MINKEKFHLKTSDLFKIYRWSSTFILFFSLFAIPGAQGQESRYESDLKNLSDYLFYLNYPSIVEPAGSMGSYGTRLGLGVHFQEGVNENPLIDHVLGRDSSETEAGQQKQNETLRSPRFYLMHGTRWPIDFGLSAGYFDETQLKHWSVFSQFTFLEELGMPSASLRMAYSNLVGIKDIEIKTFAMSVVGSYGFARFFNVFGSIGISQNSAMIGLMAPENYGLTEQQKQENLVYQHEAIQCEYLGGLRVHVSPTINLSGEYSSTLEHETTMATKLSVFL